MGKVIDGTRVPPHGMYYMEGAGGIDAEPTAAAPEPAPDEHRPSCFALEEERGESWKGTGAAKSPVNERRPTL